MAVIGLALAALAISGFSQFAIDNRERAFFPPDDPIIERTDWLSERMGSSKDAMLLLYIPTDGDVLSPFSLSQLRTVADEATTLPYVTDTKSIFDDDKTVIVRDDDQSEEQLAVVSILQGADLFSEEGIEDLRGDLRAAPTVLGRSVARDFASAVVTIQVELEEPLEDDGLSRNERIDALKTQVDGIEKLLVESEPGARVLLVGSGLFEYASTQVLREDVRQLFPIFGLAFLALLFAFYRSVVLAIGASLFVGIVIASTAGAAAWAGLALSTLSVSGLLLVGTLAVADLVHVSNGYFSAKAADDNQSAVQQSFERHLTPIIATTASTMIGASALYFSPAEPIRTFATVILIGVFLALVFTALFVPSILVLCQRRRLGLHDTMVQILLRLSRGARSNSGATLATAAAITLVAFAGLPMMKVDDNLAGWFDPSTEFRQGMDLLDEEYLSLRTITLATRVEDADRDAALAAQDALDLGYFALLQVDLSAVSDGNWLSVATAQESWRARTLDAGTATSFRPDRMALPEELDTPSSRTLSDSGLLTQLEPGVEDWAISYFDADDATTFELLRQVSAIEATLTQPEHRERETSVQGIPYAFAEVSSSNFRGIAIGSLLAITLVSISMLAVFRSVPLAALSLLPNLVPLLLIYGTWGWFTGTLNMAAVGVFATAFGIIVDDTIHLISAFKREWQTGRAVDEAIDRAITHSGSAIFVTTVLLATGFLLLSLSDFTLTAQKAGMVGATIIVALLFDLLALPALLKVAFGRNEAGPMPTPQSA